MTKEDQARNICYAHGLARAAALPGGGGSGGAPGNASGPAAGAVWGVTHNFFQGPAPSSQGDAGDFSLLE
jgi:hypothetical protein